MQFIKILDAQLYNIIFHTHMIRRYIKPKMKRNNILLEDQHISSLNRK